MPTNTPKFNLIKPLKSEKYNVDQFNTNADTIDSQIYSKTEVDTALDGKAPLVHTHPISEVTNLQTALNGKVDKLMATNLVTNGATQTFTGYVNNVTTWGAIDLIQNSIYYIRRIGTLVSGTETAGVTGGIRSLSPSTFILIEGTNTQPTSNVFTFNQTTRLGVTLTAYGANPGTYTFGSVILINLTQTFGAGNEPTRLEMDRLLSVYPNSWFNGTSEIGSISALMRASLGGQVVTPTLLNSRTGTAQYVVSSDGLVIFRGTASGGSLNTNIFVLPENIRPVATRTFPISANSAFGVITVAVNGEVRQTVGALTNVFLDGIVLKVGV